MEIRPRLSPEEYAVVQAYRNNRVTVPTPHEAPKILLFDIETAPMKSFLWSIWQKGVQPDQVTNDWFILTWAAKWLFDSKTMSEGLTGKEARKESDTRILKGVWQLLDEADMVIGHNSDRFDIPRLNTRFLINGMGPPLPYRSIDTLKVAKKFAFTSNRLDQVNKTLGLPRKMETKFELWKKCVEGDEKALEKMRKYNKRDVNILEETYLTLRPWITSHPNIGLYIELNEPVCSNCGSTNIMWKGHYYTNVSKFRSGRCECGAIVRMRQNEFPKEKRKTLAIGVAR